MEERRRTEQNDELTAEHSIAEQQGQPERPYRPPQQPAQRPDREGDESTRGGEEGTDTSGTEPRVGPGQ